MRRVGFRASARLPDKKKQNNTHHRHHRHLYLHLDPSLHLHCSYPAAVSALKEFDLPPQLPIPFTPLRGATCAIEAPPLRRAPPVARAAAMAVMLPTSKARGRKRSCSPQQARDRGKGDQSSPECPESSSEYAASECSGWSAAQRSPSAARAAPSAARAAPTPPQVAFSTARGRPAAYFVPGAATRVAKVARGPVPPSTPPPRRWKDCGAQTEPAPWVIREPQRSTIGTQTDVFTDPMQLEEFVVAVQREVGERDQATIKAHVRAAWRHAAPVGRAMERHAIHATGRPTGRPYESAGRPAESAGPVSVAQGAKVEVQEGARDQ